MEAIPVATLLRGLRRSSTKETAATTPRWVFKHSLTTQMAAKNTAIGAGALFSNTFDFNTFAGGNFNTTTGAGALYSNTTGADNTATGYVALASNTTGGSNTANGDNA